MRVRPTGDIINILEPGKPGVVISYPDLMEHVRIDAKFQDNFLIAQKKLRQKFNALLVIPVIISWLLNLIISVFYLKWKWENVLAAFTESVNFDELLLLSPWAIISALLIIFRRKIGAANFKALVWMGVQVVKFYRLVRNKQIDEA